MGEIVYIDYVDQEIVLSDEVRSTILIKHPEIKPLIERLPDVLRSPEEIRRSAADSRAVLYYYFAEDVLGGKWVVVVVKQVDRNFISTIYVTDKMKAGEIVWKK